MMQLRLLIIFIFSINLIAESLLSSPSLKLNSNDQRVIAFRIKGNNISDNDILLKEYKSDELLNLDYISYTLLEDFPNYQSFSIVLDNSYSEDYFSFKLVIKDELAKDIFIFLPSKVQNNAKQIQPTKIYQPVELPIKDKFDEVIEMSEPVKELNLIKADEITTMWSMASSIKKETSDTSIYQIMWSIYLGNKNAFIDGNINLVRKDIDLVIPSFATMKMTSQSDAKESILAMNSLFSSSFEPAIKSLLTLTAPKIIKQETTEALPEVQEKEDKNLINVNDDQVYDPKKFIENNTKQLEMAVENKTLDKLIEVSDEQENQDGSGFGMMDLLFVAVVSVLSGVLIALIYIQLNPAKKKSISYDFDEAVDSSSSVDGLPKGLSIKNNYDEQQLDLAITYFEMQDYRNCKTIIDDILKITEDNNIKDSAESLLAKIQNK
jgi:FimV-like protein